MFLMAYNKKNLQKEIEHIREICLQKTKNGLIKENIYRDLMNRGLMKVKFHMNLK